MRNELENIEPGVFKGLVCLETVLLGTNCLKDINTADFEGLENLFMVDLNTNQVPEERQESLSEFFVYRF